MISLVFKRFSVFGRSKEGQTAFLSSAPINEPFSEGPEKRKAEDNLD
jgi:hypothetical protein